MSREDYGMERPWIKAFVIVFIALMIAGTAFYFKRGAAEKEAVSFRPVYLSRVPLNVEFSNDGPELLVVSPLDIHKVDPGESRPILVVGKLNTTNLVEAINVTPQMDPLNLSSKAAVIYNGRLIFLVSGDLGGFLEWVSWIIAHESHWDLGLYSRNSGVLLSTRELQAETPDRNWSAVGGELYKHQLLLKIIVPGRENAEFSVTPLNGKLLDYDPTTSKFRDLIIHDRSSFAANRAGWMVENHGEGNVHLKAIVGIDSEGLTLRYSLNGIAGLLLVPFSS
ncbi:hypothetical protein [Thermococcus sp.]|uniref:hypothetical protein n=3 Tax=Thermococcus sp. TaxID=35749 RepID=UPI002604EC18|nr:hypothetical protein [Thermococcus sp.]